MCSALLLSVLIGQVSIHTTVADSSRVAFIAQTPLTCETVEYDSLDFIRFTDVSVSDSIGYPEVPMITCLVALPDSVTPSLEFAFSGEFEQQVDPVYPAPARIISDDYTPAVVDSFVQDSTAYASSSFWPASRVRVIGEIRICDQRLYQVQLFPALYRASDSTLSTVSSISVSLNFDSASADWSSTGLGPFQDMARGSSIIGYHAVTQTHAPTPTYFGKVDPDSGPSRMPDYVIICASGLYDDCDDAIDDLAEHRVSLNGFDVALVTTDDILDDFGGEATAITDEIIRNFTEHMWEEWTQTSGKKPYYLLLIGDHETSSYYDEPWFLPTHQYPYGEEEAGVNLIGNDEWYAYFNDDTSIDNDYPDMMVGRLSVKNGGVLLPDTLSTLIDNLIDLEDPITQIPIPDNRRRIVRLAGAGNDHPDTYNQTYGIDNTPGRLWTSAFAGWMNYGYTTYYCGDGRDFTYSDESLMQSNEFRDHCLDEFGDGAGVAFYTDHGSTHLFSAGLEWVLRFIPQDHYTKGARDSTFNNYQIEQNLTASQDFASPFILLLCCSSGTFNHTVYEHENPTQWAEFCFYDGQVDPPDHYDFGTDCIAEKLLKHTDVPVAGVFCGSQPSCMFSYDHYGRGILEAIYVRGFSRLGDAIACARLEHADFFTNSSGTSKDELGQFNLLGDPALDIGDRVRFTSDCDLVAYNGDLSVWDYPYETASGAELPISFTVHNNGAQDSDEFDIRIVFKDVSHSDTVYITDCDEITAGEYDDFQYTWECENWFDPPMELTVFVEADYQQDCDDSWFGNNTAGIRKQLNGIYPSEEGWPVSVSGVVNTTPILVNLDFDLNLEIVAHTGNSLTAFEQDGTVKWELKDVGLSGFDHHPLAADLDHDGSIELIAACDGGVMAVDPDGEILDTIETNGSVFAVGNVYSTSGLELCIAHQKTLYLYSWNSALDEFSYIGSELITLTGFRNAYSVSCADMNDDSYDDIVFCCGFIEEIDPVQNLIVYDWVGSSTLFCSDDWSQTVGKVHPAAGELDETAMVGYPFGGYDYTSEHPAILVEPDGIIEAECDEGNVSAAKLVCGVFADWYPLVTGADAFVLPSETECLAWNNEGDRYSNDWPTGEYSGAEQGSLISPTALGDLDDDGVADVLFSTWLSDGWELLVYDSDGEEIGGFPIALPDDISALGGFAIADIDRDGSVEVVFGTSDGLLHCWELDSCTTGYAPWPQFQHDQSRTGVLE